MVGARLCLLFVGRRFARAGAAQRATGHSARYSSSVIVSFADSITELVWLQEAVPALDPRIHRTAHRKLLQLNAAGSINDLRVPPGNRLEKLSGDRSGQYSIRINDQWRICFSWTDTGPAAVQIVDYH